MERLLPRGAGYAPLGATSSLPTGTPPAFVRPIDTVSGPTIDPLVYGNSFDGSACVVYGRAGVSV